MNNHYDRLFWNAYIADTLDEPERQRAEDHLLDCEACLALYLACVEEESPSMPALDPKQSEALANDVVHALFPKKRWFQHVIFHYAVAASITLLLMGSGAFDRMTHAVQLEQIVADKPTLTDKLMQTANGWLDELGSILKERKPEHE
ncbi:zf-HC2 domain-containing protein [Xylanibacillus composti]|uniref:Putative zinc-finger domain-containing protein n=1 Tax=Xylanibacillus composti TaxID=1572762 RepID=A0A8J4H153_9BACL|nr:zf-HC2 domain-containing protein [Xylanibacillus composti]GIQ68969.1 hypothetical protein XYCOK13_17930 [Xylanibacillus composti]